MKIILIVFLLIFLEIKIIENAEVSCLDYIGEPVEWWFLFSKQVNAKSGDDSLGGGYIYADSNGYQGEISNSFKGEIIKKSKSKKKKSYKLKTIKQLLEQHTSTAYNDNKAVFDACTLEENVIKEDFQKNDACLAALEAFFNSQTWFHDTGESQDNGAILEKRSTQLQNMYMTEEEKLEILAEKSDIDDEDAKDTSFDPTQDKPRPKVDVSDGIHSDEYFQILDNKAIEYNPGSARYAHSKFLFSLDINNKNGYIIDHSANIPSDVQKDDFGFYKVFNQQTLISSSYNSGTSGKFAFSHHFFCFNFGSSQFNRIVSNLKTIKPRFVRSNYIGLLENGKREISLVPQEVDIKFLLSGYTDDDNSCNEFYKNLYISFLKSKTNEYITTNGLVAHLLQNAVFDNLKQAKCLNYYRIKQEESDYGSLNFYTFNSRNKPFGYRDQLNEFVSKEEDNYKLHAPHLTYNSYGMDPFTIIAKDFGGPFLVSTLPQAKRVEVPTIATKNFQIQVIKSWNLDGEVHRKRHEKLLLSENTNENYPNKVCVGDGNRNLVHSLYAGMVICFNNDYIAKTFRSSVHRVNIENMYSSTSKFKASYKTIKNKGYPPGFVQTLLDPSTPFSLSNGDPQPPVVEDDGPTKEDLESKQQSRTLRRMNSKRGQNIKNKLEKERIDRQNKSYKRTKSQPDLTTSSKKSKNHE